MQSPRLVIVYLGTRIPKYLLKNMDHLQKMFPLLPKSIVLDSKSARNFEAPSGWNIHLYVRSAETQQLLRSLDLDHKFRNGFWLLTLERMLAFLELHEFHPSESVLQIEGDVLLMPSFPFERLSELTKLAWMKNDIREDIATLVYSPSVSSSRFLADRLRGEVVHNASTSDMRALRSIAEQFPNDVYYLPVSPGEDNDWGGVFDALAVGIWLLGVDPRNEAGKSIRRRLPFESPSLEVENAEFRVSGNQLECRFPNTEWVPIWCLHLHSKYPKYFEYDALVASLSRSISGVDSVRFSMLGFIAWLREVFRDVFSTQALKKAWAKLSK